MIPLLLNLIAPDVKRIYVIEGDDLTCHPVIADHWWQATHTEQQALAECAGRRRRWVKQHPSEYNEWKMSVKVNRRK